MVHPAGRAGLGLHRQSMRYSIKPAAHSLPPVNRAGPSREDKKNGLKDILGVVQVVQDALAHAQHHRSMPSQQGCEGILIPESDEALQELMVRQFMVLPSSRQLADEPQERTDLCAAHVLFSR